MSSNNILVIGSTGGVGLAVAKALTKKGYNVYGTCRTQTQKKQLESGGICKTALTMDLTDEQSIEDAFVQLKKEGVTNLTASINCAAITKAAPLETITSKKFFEIFQINVFGTLKAMQLSIPLLRVTSGRLIMVGSAGGDMALPMLGAYSASKFALEAMCDALRRELAHWNISVSLIKPGAIKTNMTRQHLEELDETINSASTLLEKQYTPLFKSHSKRMGYGYKNGVTPEKVAEVVTTALTAKHPKTRYYVGLEPTLVSSFSKFMPDKIQDKVLEQLFPEK